jgi:hypothetical protein
MFKTVTSPKLRMQDDPRFIQLLAGLGGSCLNQFEIYRKGRYAGEDTIEDVIEDEQWRLQVLTARAWDAATLFYKRLTKEEPTKAFNEKV